MGNAINLFQDGMFGGCSSCICCMNVCFVRDHLKFSILSYKVFKFHPSNGFTVAQFGPPSLPVPGTCVSIITLGFLVNDSMCSQVIPVNGIFSRLDQIEPVCPAAVPISI